jgi:glutamyl endopeptidase
MNVLHLWNAARRGPDRTGAARRRAARRVRTMNFALVLLAVSGMLATAIHSASEFPRRLRYQVGKTYQYDYRATIDASSSSRIILGSLDDLTKVLDPDAFPHRAVVLINGGGTSCSGWLYGENVVATAGHCVFEKGVWFTNVTVVSTPSPRRTCNAKTLFSTVGWTTAAAEEYDYGAIELDCDMGLTSGWLGYGWETIAPRNARTKVIGYLSRPANRPPELFSSQGKIDAARSDQLFHDNDTLIQMSGSPILVDRRNCRGCAVAIHSRAAHAGAAPHDTSNHGPVISRRVFENLRAWKQRR